MGWVPREQTVTLDSAARLSDRVARLSGVEQIGIGTDVDLDGRAKLPPEELKARQINPRNDRPGPNQLSQEDLRSN
jgi:hypothetical protein